MVQAVSASAVSALVADCDELIAKYKVMKASGNTEAASLGGWADMLAAIKAAMDLIKANPEIFANTVAFIKFLKDLFIKELPGPVSPTV